MMPVLNQMPPDTMRRQVNQAKTAFNKMNPKASRARNFVMEVVLDTSLTGTNASTSPQLKYAHSNTHRDKPESGKTEAATVPIPYQLSQKSTADQESQTMRKGTH